MTQTETNLHKSGVINNTVKLIDIWKEVHDQFVESNMEQSDQICSIFHCLNILIIYYEVVKSIVQILG